MFELTNYNEDMAVEKKELILKKDMKNELLRREQNMKITNQE